MLKGQLRAADSSTPSSRPTGVGMSKADEMEQEREHLEWDLDSFDYRVTCASCDAELLKLDIRKYREELERERYDALAQQLWEKQRQLFLTQLVSGLRPEV